MQLPVNQRLTNFREGLGGFWGETTRLHGLATDKKSVSRVLGTVPARLGVPAIRLTGDPSKRQSGETPNRRKKLWSSARLTHTNLYALSNAQQLLGGVG